MRTLAVGMPDDGVVESAAEQELGCEYGVVDVGMGLGPGGVANEQGQLVVIGGGEGDTRRHGAAADVAGDDL